MDKNISISLLNAKNIPTFLRSAKEYVTRYGKEESYFKTWIHFDVMDGQFVPNTGIDLKYIKTTKNLGLYADTHLMVERPIGDHYVEKAILNGTDAITIHYEIEQFAAVIKRLKEIQQELYQTEERILTIGVSLKPDTPVSVLLPYQEYFDKVLIMSVEPGLGGQAYLKKTTKKIKEAKSVFPSKQLQIDGGINFDTFMEPLLLGVESFVIGSFITNDEDIEASLMAFNLLYEIRDLPVDANVEFDKRLLQIVPGGYGEQDCYLGISVPTLRKFANKWYTKIRLETLIPFITSCYHDDRRFACFCLSSKMKKVLGSKTVDIKQMEKIVSFMDANIQYINNWDLTDDVAPNVLGKYLLQLDQKQRREKLSPYLKSNNTWIKRIGIISLLTLARAGEYTLILEICQDNMYHTFHLIQKAVGWVLREVYKKHPKEIVAFLHSHYQEKKIPPIVLSYACEKMIKAEKTFIKEGKK